MIAYQSLVRRRSRGFSLVELLVTAAILGILASVAVPLTEVTVKRQKERSLRIALQDIRHAIDAYKAAVSNGNIVLQPGQSGYPPTLTDLVAGVADAKLPGGPRLYFLRSVPRDPFAADKNTAAVDTWGKRSFSSPPESPKEGDDVFDVYSLSNQSGLDGSPYAQW